MRKLLLVFVIVMVSAQVHSQDLDDGFAGPEAGDLLIEITGNPFEGNSLLNFGSLRARLFVGDVIAPRLTIGMSLNNSQTTPDRVTNLSEYTIAPGVEYFFQRNGGFRSYAAVDLIFGQRFASVETTTGQTVDGSTQVPNGNNYFFTESLRGHTQFGGELALGADYHFNSRFYIGVEIGFQYVYKNKSDVKVDGALYQKGTVYNTGSINNTNSFRVGFKLL